MTRTLSKIDCRYAGNTMDLPGAAGHTVAKTMCVTNNQDRASAAKGRMLLACTLRTNKGTRADTVTSSVMGILC